MCPLCHGDRATEFRVENLTYLHCAACDLRYLDPAARLSEDEERERYGLHEAGDEGYRKFVSPMLEMLRDRVPRKARGLDFGAGRYPVLSGYLRDLGYDVTLYDPFFWPNEVRGPFDFIAACEVVEHLYDPKAVFTRLYDWLQPGGWLTIMTDLVQADTRFETWHYRRDPTHVVFYSEATFHWIAERYGFQEVTRHGRVVGLRRAATDARG